MIFIEIKTEEKGSYPQIVLWHTLNQGHYVPNLSARTATACTLYSLDKQLLDQLEFISCMVHRFFSL